jgi:hypothetical protein
MHLSLKEQKYLPRVHASCRSFHSCSPALLPVWQELQEMSLFWVLTCILPLLPHANNSVNIDPQKKQKDGGFSDGKIR